MFLTSDALKTKIYLFMKCVISHYFQTTMGELPDLLAIIFSNYKIADDLTLVRIKLTCIINDGLKYYFLKKCMRLVKSANHVTVSLFNYYY